MRFALFYLNPFIATTTTFNIYEVFFSCRVNHKCEWMNELVSSGMVVEKIDVFDKLFCKYAQVLSMRFWFDYLHIYGISWGINFDSIYPLLRSRCCWVVNRTQGAERAKQVRVAFTVIEGKYYIVRWIKSNLWWLLFRRYVAFKIHIPQTLFYINWQWI